MKIVYQKCGSAGSLFGAAMGYAGPIESVITLILLKILLGCGVVTKSGGVALDEGLKEEIQKMINAGVTVTNKV